MMDVQATRLFDMLRDREVRVVFAESCTAGMVSATLAAVPGISDYLCGSMVTYRPEIKENWLGVDHELLVEHSAERDAVTRRMAEAVLERTSAAQLAAAITGHLGPAAPDDLDGVVFIAVAMRQADGRVVVESTRQKLKSHERVERQREASRMVLSRLQNFLAGQTDS